MDQSRLNSQLRSLVDCSNYGELTHELDKLLKIAIDVNPDLNREEDWDVVHEFENDRKILSVRRTETFKEATFSAQLLNDTKDEHYWTELIHFTRDLIFTMVERLQTVGRTDARNISDTNMRKLPFGYWPPELFRGEEVWEKSHLYTLGAFLIHLITERPPFNKYDYPQLLYNVGSGKLLLEPPVNCHPLFASLIVECCRFNPEKRPSFQALCDRYFTAR